MLENWERIEILVEAQEKLGEVIDLIRRAVDDTILETPADAYLIPELKMAQTRNHEYLGRRTNLDELIQALEEISNEDNEA